MDTDAATVKLTDLASCGGCAAKYSAARLEELLRGFVPTEAENLLVGLAPADDAAVYRLDDERALIFTLDFFPPVVDDGADYGAIAATNALNDVFAMGGTPLLALSIAAFPEELPTEILASIFVDADAEHGRGRAPSRAHPQCGHRRHGLRSLRPRTRGGRPQRGEAGARVGAPARDRRGARPRPQGCAHERRPTEPRLRGRARDAERHTGGDRVARLRPADRGWAAGLAPCRPGSRARGGVRGAQALHPEDWPRGGGKRSSRGVNRRGMIHGRFQPFHNGHLEYLRGAAERSDEVWIGITNPDPARIKPEDSDPLRHLPESNPFSYAERLLMVKAAAADLGLEPAAVHVIPFPVNEPELWSAYVPQGVTQYLRLFSAWGGTKLERLREAGYEVVVLDEGAEKEISGADVRAALRDGGDWESLVPPGVARVVRELYDSLNVKPL